MSLRIVSADERLSAASNKTSLAIFGPPGSGKTSLLKTLPAADTICLDLEAGMKSVQDWQGDSIAVRTFTDALDLGCLVGGVNPAADPSGFFSEGHYQHLSQTYPDLVQMIAGKRIVFVDSITDLTRQRLRHRSHHRGLRRRLPGFDAAPVGHGRRAVLRTQR